MQLACVHAHCKKIFCNYFKTAKNGLDNYDSVFFMLNISRRLLAFCMFYDEGLWVGFQVKKNVFFYS